MTTPTTNPARAALIAAADGAIWAALTQAGIKLRGTALCPRSRRAQARTVTPALLHTTLPMTAEAIDHYKVLAGAWDRIPELAARHGVDAGCLTTALDSYCRELLAAGQPHDAAYVPRIIASCRTLRAHDTETAHG